MTRVALGFGQDGILLLLFPSYRFRYLKEQSPVNFSLKTQCIWFQRKMSMVNTKRYKWLHNMGCVFVDIFSDKLMYLVLILIRLLQLFDIDFCHTVIEFQSLFYQLHLTVTAR